MKNKNMFLKAAVLTLGIMIIISSTQVLSLKVTESEYEMQTESKHTKNMTFFGFGNIKSLTVDGEYDIKGIINGNISIQHSPFGFPYSYCLFIKNNFNKKIELKWKLPEKFILKKFSGFGKIYYYPAPHGPDWTKFFLTGTFEKIITN